MVRFTVVLAALATLVGPINAFGPSLGKVANLIYYCVGIPNFNKVEISK